MVTLQSIVDKIRHTRLSFLAHYLMIASLPLMMFPVFFAIVNNIVISGVFIILLASAAITGIVLTRTLWQGAIRQFHVPRLFLLWNVIVVWLIGASLLRGNFSASFWGDAAFGDGLMTVIAITIFCWLMITVFQNTTMRLWFVRIAVFMGILLSYTLYTESFPFFNWILNDGGLLTNSSFSASFLIFPIGFSIIGFITEPQTRLRILYAVAAVIMLLNPLYINLSTSVVSDPVTWLGIAKTGSLSIVFGTIVGITCILVCSKKQKVRMLGILAGIMIAASFITINIFLSVPGSAPQHLLIKHAGPTRLLYWKAAIQGIAQRPLTGWGWQQFPQVHQTYFNPINLSPQYFTEGWVSHPHNVLADFGIGGGVPAMVLILLLFGGTLIYCVHLARSNHISASMAAVFCGLFAGLYLQLWFMFFIPLTLLWYLLCIIYLASHRGSVAPGRIVHLPAMGRLLTGALIATVWVSVFIVILYSVYLPYKKFSHIYWDTRFNRTSIDHAANIAGIHNLSRWGWGSGDTDWTLRTPDVNMSNDFMGRINDNQYDTIRRNQSAYLAVLISMTDAVPGSYKTRIGPAILANIMATQSKDPVEKSHYAQIAQTYATQTIALSPNNPMGYIELSQAVESLGDSDRSVELAQFALDLEPGFEYSQKRLAQAIAVRDSL